MSSEHQRYSLENQQMRIAEYAAARGYDIIDTYADSGCSGLTLKERRELNRLLRDVTDPNRQFSTILVLDISRWGRFLDPDQHAAYEFLCREMGARVEYVAEIFENDGSLASSILKHLKRAMAGEFSRELSTKVSFAQLAAVQRGHKQGGSVSIGLRRLLVDAEGVPKQALDFHERKALSDDRVVVVPGPEDEQRIVRHIYDLFLRGAPIMSIPRHLNHIGAPPPHGSPWTYQKVRNILTNEIYTGTYVFNRTSRKLKTPCVANPPDTWVRVPMCDGIVSSEDFQKVQALLATPRQAKSRTYSREKLLAAAKTLLAQKGRLSASLIDETEGMPSSFTYRSAFGSLENLYAEVGYPFTARRRLPRSKAYTKEELIDQLRNLLASHKRLTREIIEQSRETASCQTFRMAFGDMTEAYRAVGYMPSPFQHRRARPINKEIALRKLKALFDKHGTITQRHVTVARSMPDAHWYKREFGSFAAACAQAGIEWTPGATRRPGYILPEFLDRPIGGHAPAVSRVKSISDDHLFQIVRQVYHDNGYITGQLLFACPGMPSVRRVRKRFARITDLYTAAGLPADIPTRNRRPR